MTYKDPVDVDYTGVNSDTLSWDFAKVNEEQDRLGLLKQKRGVVHTGCASIHYKPGRTQVHT